MRKTQPQRRSRRGQLSQEEDTASEENRRALISLEEETASKENRRAQLSHEEDSLRGEIGERKFPMRKTAVEDT